MKLAFEMKKEAEFMYAIAVHGYAPEFCSSAVLYRRQGKFDDEEESGRQKEIKCPYCGRLLMSVAVTRKLELYRFPRKAKVKCHECRCCNICHEKIGIIYLTA